MTYNRDEKIKKIEYMLKKVGVENPFNRWIKLPQVAMIYLDEDSNCILGDTDLVYFDSKNCVLKIYRDKSVRNIEIVGSDYPANLFYDFRNIAGLICSVFRGPTGSYYRY